MIAGGLSFCLSKGFCEIAHSRVGEEIAPVTCLFNFFQQEIDREEICGCKIMDRLNISACNRHNAIDVT